MNLRLLLFHFIFETLIENYLLNFIDSPRKQSSGQKEIEI